MTQPFDPNDQLWMYENDNGVTKVSYWSMGVYETCPGKYNFIGKQQLLPVGVEPDKRNALVGSIEHSVLEDFFLKKDYSRQDLSDDVEPTLEKFLAFNRVGWRSEEDKLKVIAEIKEDLSTSHRVLKEANVLVPQAKPELTVGAYLTHRIYLKGRIDLYVEDPNDAVVIDNKAVESETNLDVWQLVFYRLLLRQAGMPVPKRLGWYLTKFGYIKWRDISDSDEKKLITKIEETVEGIRAGRFPFKPSPYHCQWCDYNSVCIAFKNKFPNQSLLDDVKTIRTSGTVKF